MRARIVVMSLDVDPILQLAYPDGPIFYTNTSGSRPMYRSKMPARGLSVPLPVHPSVAAP
jgi:hypothetical protein